jgi:hypothetical protein
MINQFQQDRYLEVKSLIPQDICKIATKYALIQEEVDYSPEDDEDAQVRGAHSKYSDTLMETLMFFLHPKMQKLTGLELCPTYTYYRVYRPGQELYRHKDRPSCEVSVTVCLGNLYLDTATDYSWGMYVDKESYKTPLAQDGGFASSNNAGSMIAQSPGDGIIYRGCDIEHWRDQFIAGKGSYQVQAFFHYIDKNGPFYPKYAFDERKGLGYKHNDRRNN